LHRWIGVSDDDAKLIAKGADIRRRAACVLPTRPRHGEQAAVAFHHVTNLPKPRWIELSELDRYSSPTAQAFLDLAAKPLP